MLLKQMTKTIKFVIFSPSSNKFKNTDVGSPSRTNKTFSSQCYITNKRVINVIELCKLKPIPLKNSDFSIHYNI